MYKFLFTGRWLGYLLIAAVFASICVGLGFWQLDRRAEVLADIAKITNNYSAAPIGYDQAKPLFGKLDPDKEWSQVSLTGSYDIPGQRVVRNRPLNGQPGYEVVVPLKLTTGETVVIDRGWLPIGNNEGGRPDTVPEPVTGTVTVVARLRPAEPALQRGALSGQLASIDLTAYAKDLGYPLLTGAYAQMAQESPAAATEPVGFPMPSIDEGPHLSYSMQWFAFGILFFIGYGYAARQQALLDRYTAEQESEDMADSEQAYGRGSAFTKRRPVRPSTPGRRATAEEEEDAVLDAQGFQGS
ncbi:SURF1 family protein [Paenarthrobacter sp. PH39-S1]|uniref:SURF1 family cytochrome oxidase biogenesis protein n=1 Tax=Paenarthrobacter sp. PH39-S1 TaxID=3046204 RepID=UPI0024BA91C3|nr:SURF1 family protein [Paenarthrobacter sp. PH39-S1]MDJ0356716.1 SURF1 family protein [Paenarthrobacter sp. PH39-S1]